MKLETQAVILLVVMILFTCLQWFWNGGRYKEDLDYLLTIVQNLRTFVTPH